MSLKRNAAGESAEYKEGDIFPASPFFPGFKQPVFKYKDESEPYWLDPDREVEAYDRANNRLLRGRNTSSLSLYEDVQVSKRDRRRVYHSNVAAETFRGNIRTSERTDAEIKQMDKDQLRDLITRVLQEAGLYSDSAVELLMLTAATESKLGYYIKQIRGPALGIFQMEPRTHDDIWKNYLQYKKSIGEHFGAANWRNFLRQAEKLEYNLKYSILMARVHYLRVPDPLPDADDVEGLAAYWKDHYNTYLGAGTVEKAIAAYNTYC